jgi:hypothetical protein
MALVLGLLAAAGARGGIPRELAAIAGALPEQEVGVLLDVGREYRLAGDALKLLLVIRKIENGPPGVEMGVASDYPGHRARRYAGSPLLSLRVQARWAAGTIRKHFRGDLDAFAKRYCPPKWRHWASMARHWMHRAAPAAG